MPLLFSLSDLQPISDFLQSHCGLAYGENNISQLQHAVQTRMASCQLNDVDQYLSLLKQSLGSMVEEFSFLIEELTLGETAFYRIPEHFRLLKDQLIPTYHARNHHLDILSLACSSGEEPYSLAILLKMNFPALSFSITAVDIDKAALEKAKRGRYDAKAIAGLDEQLVQRFFVEQDGKYLLDESIKASVKFLHFNLFDARLNLPSSGFDLIFCRDVLSYFSNDKVKQLIRILYDLNRLGGYLFVGDHESLSGYHHDFRVHEQANLFFYQRENLDRMTQLSLTAELLNDDVDGWTAVEMRTMSSKVGSMTPEATTINKKVNEMHGEASKISTKVGGMQGKANPLSSKVNQLVASGTSITAKLQAMNAASSKAKKKKAKKDKKAE